MLPFIVDGRNDMVNMSSIDKQKFIFGILFYLPNKLQVMLDQSLAQYDITAKQWFLTVIIEQFGDNPPTISEAAEAMSSTHQNVKQIALKLEKKGFLFLEKDQVDRRITRLKLTDKCFSFWEARQDESIRFLTELFAGFDDAEIDSMFHNLNKLYEKIGKIE